MASSGQQGAVEALKERRMKRIHSDDKSPTNEPSFEEYFGKLEQHYEAIIDRLSRCLDGIANNEAYLKGLSLRQARVTVGVESGIRRHSSPLPSGPRADLATPPHDSASHAPFDTGEYMRELMKARRFYRTRNLSMDNFTREHLSISGPSMSIGQFSALNSLSELPDDIEMPEFTRSNKQSQHVKNMWKILSEPASSHTAMWVNRLIILLIGLSLSLSHLGSVAPSTFSFSFVLPQLVCDSIFSLELLIRFYASPSRVVFVKEIYTLLEICGSFPLLGVRVTYAFQKPLESDSWPYLILVALGPVLRLLMVLRRFEQCHLLVRAFEAAWEALPVMLYTLTIIIYAFSAMIFVVEPRWNITSFTDAMWLTVVTTFTVGYGDSLPKSDAGRFITSCLMVVSTIYMAIPIGIVGDAFSRVWADRESCLLLRRMSTRLRFARVLARDIPALFHRFDHDETGKISLEQFAEIIDFMGVNLNEAQQCQLFNIIDDDGSGEISDEEFVKALFPADFQKVYGQSASLFDNITMDSPTLPYDIGGSPAQANPKSIEVPADGIASRNTVQSHPILGVLSDVPPFGESITSTGSASCVCSAFPSSPTPFDLPTSRSHGLRVTLC